METENLISFNTPKKGDHGETPSEEAYNASVGDSVPEYSFFQTTKSCHTDENCKVTDNVENLISFNTPKKAKHGEIPSEDASDASIGDNVCDYPSFQTTKLYHTKENCEVLDNVEKLISFNSPEKHQEELVLTSENNVISDNVFTDVRNGNQFFKTAKLYDVEDGRESLMLLKNLDDFDIGRESLGILNMNLSEEGFNNAHWLSIPDINLENTIASPARKYSVSSLLNRAVLPSDSYSISPNASSKMVSYNTHKSKESLTISSISSLGSHMCSPLNVDFSSSNRWSHNISTTRSEWNKSERNIDTERALSTGLRHIKKSSDLFKRISSPKIKFELDKSDGDDLNDLIFVEARDLASKLADGSICETESGEMNLLDCTPQPNWISEQDSFANFEPTKEEMLKMLDKMIPKSKSLLSVEKESESEERVESHELKNKSHEIKSESPFQMTGECSQNSRLLSTTSSLISSINKSCKSENSCINIIDNKSLSINGISSNINESNFQAKNILNKLSELLKSEHSTSQQRAEGQDLINKLANMILSSDNNCPIVSKTLESVDDSIGKLDQGIGQNKANRNEEVVDLRVKSLGNTNSPQPFDLSANSNNLKKTFNRSRSYPNDEMKNARTCTIDEHFVQAPQIAKSRASIRNNLNKLNLGKLKGRKTDDKKKGPLKAVLPIGNMARDFTKTAKSTVLPLKNSSIFKSKKSPSSSKMEQKLFPVAQSTPDGSSSNHGRIQLSPSHLPKPKFICPVSPLARPTSTRTLCSSNENLSSKALNNNSDMNLNRRRSAGDLKSLQRPIIKRSNSLSRNSGIKFSINRVGDSITTHKHDADPSQVKRESGQSCIEKNRSKIFSIKPLNLMAKLKQSIGKENIPH